MSRDVRDAARRRRPFHRRNKRQADRTVWSSEDALARYKERNPELMTFLPTRLTRSLINRIRNGLAGEGTTGFFLLAEDDPDADLDDGRPISLDGITLESDLTPQPAQVQL